MFDPNQGLQQNPELIDLTRQRRLADMLMAQGTQAPQGQTVAGGVYVPPNPLEYLGKLFNTYAGVKGNEALDVKQAELAQKLREQGLNEVNDILTLSQGRQALPSQELAGPAYNGVAPSIQYPAIEANPQAAMAKALTAQSPQAQTLAAPLMQNLLPKKTEKLIEYDTYKKEGGKKSFSDWSKEITPAEQARLDIDLKRLNLEAANQNKAQFLETPNGYVAVNPKNPNQATPVMLNGQPIMGKNPLNETQAKASLYQGTMLNSTKEMKNLEDKGFNPASFKTQAQLSMGGTATGNAMMPEDAQRYKQASDAFANSYIRFQSGAGINQDEIQRNLKNMMPALGDKPGQIEQKQRAREEAIKLMGLVAGPGNQLANNPQMPSVPKTNAPVKIDPALLQYMTPEQRKLFGG